MGFNLISKKLPHTVMIFLLIDIGLCIAYTINHLSGHSFSKLTSLLDLDGENSIASWYSSTQFFCVFISSAIFSYHKIRENSKSFPLIVLPIMFLLMSIDESVQIHEWLGLKSDILFSSGSRIGTPFQNTGIWMFVFGLPFLALFLLIVYSLKHHFSDKPFAFEKLVIGMIIMLIGALGFETLSNFIGKGFLFIEIVLEEGLEMIGVTVMFWAMYDIAIDYMPGMD
ncbi:hypothetical protein JYT87_02180 [Nitrospira defluvii]|nr:hypothetical protein [Nitrospira defluvii]